MKQLSFKCIILSVWLLLGANAALHAEDILDRGISIVNSDSLQTDLQENDIDKNKPKKRYNDRIEGYRKSFMRLAPTHSKLQFYGDMGLASLGIGWDYGKNSQWETDLLFGFIPKYSSNSVKATMTLKQTFNPWSINLSKTGRFTFEPLQAGLYMNTIFGNEFWVREPSKYPGSYYRFSSRLRFSIFLGESFTYDIPEHKRCFIKSISAFGEISTTDLYLVSAVPNRYLGPEDWLRLSFGLKFRFF